LVVAFFFSSIAIGKSHPEFLTSCFGTISEPLDVSKSEVQEFVKHLYAEVTQLFPDTWIHVGGDEVDMACWEDSTSINKYLKSHKNMDAIGLLNQFEQNLLGMVISDLNRRPIVWQELFDSNVQLPPETIVDIWKFWMEESSLVGATAAGYDVIVSACWYLDYMTDDWWKYHACNPRGFPLSAEQKQHILGGHASMWGEGIDGTNFFSTVWPRASSMAEVLWSGSPPVDHSMLSKEDVMDRLSRLRCSLLRRYDVPASPIHPDYCI
jgi:hexosaminidase